MDPELPHRAVLLACSRCPLSIVSSRSAVRLARRGVRLQLGCTCPGSLPSANFSLNAHAYCHSNRPKTFKARTMSTRRSFRCCKNGLAVFFLAIGTTTILQAAGFGATFGPDGGYSVAFRALFLYFLERSSLDLHGKDFTFVI